METTIENPVIKDEGDELRNQLRDMAEKAGPLTGDEFEPEPSATETETRAPVDTETEQTVSSPDTKPDKTDKPERPRDELGRFTKTEDGKDIPELERKPAEQEVPTKPDAKKLETPYSKAEKERQRQENLLKDFEQKKQAFREESERIRGQLQREAAELKQAKEARQPQAQQQRQQFSSKELFAAHQDFKTRAKEALKNGDYDAFNENEALSDQALQHAQQHYQRETEEAQKAQFEQWNGIWRGAAQKAIESDPELADPSTPLGKEVTALLESHGQVFWTLPNGFEAAVQVAKWKLGYDKSTGLISGLEDENKQLKAENARLNGSLSLSGSGPSGGPIPAKEFDDMSLDEMKEQLRGVAENAGSLATA